MKICIWCTKIFDLGGTKRVVTLLANELVKEHDVTIMVYQDRFKEDRNMYHMSEDIKVDFIDNNEFVNRHHTPAFCWRYLVQKLNAKYGIFNKEKYNDILADAIFPKKTREKWVKYLNEQNYDIIITTASLSLRLGMLAPELNAKTIGWQHNCYAGYLDVPNVVFWKQECLLQEYLPKLDRYIVLSDYDKRDYKKFLDIDTDVKINPRSFVSERKCDPKSKRFLMATRFVYAKGLDLMMESFEEFCKQDDEWQLDIIGAGDLWNQIVADAKRRGIEDRVNFVGYTNEPEKYYLNSSVFLLPSRWEGWPMVIMEAFEFGLPVIAFHTGAMDLIIDDGKTGYLPEAFDTKKFTDAMLKLAHDEELRREMSRKTCTPLFAQKGHPPPGACPTKACTSSGGTIFAFTPNCALNLALSTFASPAATMSTGPCGVKKASVLAMCASSQPSACAASATVALDTQNSCTRPAKPHRPR